MGITQKGCTVTAALILRYTGWACPSPPATQAVIHPTCLTQIKHKAPLIFKCFSMCGKFGDRNNSTEAAGSILHIPQLLCCAQMPDSETCGRFSISALMLSTLSCMSCLKGYLLLLLLLLTPHLNITVLV